MKVLLAEPPFLRLQGDGRTSQTFPLGLGYLGAALAPDHDVAFLLPDLSAARVDFWDELEVLLGGSRWGMVGITATSNTIRHGLELARRLRALMPEVVIVFGGSHATLAPQATLEAGPEIDCVIAGEGEAPLRLLADIVESDRRDLLESVPGLTFRAESGAVRTNPGPSRPTDLDSLAIPMRGPILGCADPHPAVFQSMITVRGCPFDCAYCSVPRMSGKAVRRRSTDNILAEIEELRTRWGVPFIFFQDSVFTLHRQATLELCRGMVERGLTVPFTCQTRTDCLDNELLAAMRAAGCHRIMLGIESGRTETLERIGKESDLEAIRGAVKAVKAAGILCSGFFILGFPWEDEAAMTGTVNFAEELELDTVHLFSANPLPFTRLWEMAGRPEPVDAFDFTGPAVNLTALPDNRYREVFKALATRVDGLNARAAARCVARRLVPA